ncbi:MAG: VTT domain-containing protein [Candidatus Aceula meridiana]|nr:VTT domain-containing protein [Candidatus Aceula meridiana]
MQNTKFSPQIKFVIFILLLVLFWQAGQILKITDFDYEGFLKSLPTGLSSIIFIGLYVGVTFVAWLAKDLFKIVGAVVFGAYLSTFLIWVAEIINAFILFHLSRKLGRDFIQSRLKGSFVKIDEKIARSGFWSIFVFRAFPIVPFRFLDLGVGLTKIPFRKYLILVILGSPVRIFWIQFVLSGVGKAVFKNPQVMVDYLTQNTLVFVLSFAYLIVTLILVIFLARKKEKRHG